MDIGPISFYLGLKVDRNREKRTIKLSQLAYIQKVLTKYYFNKTNPTNTLIKEVHWLHWGNTGEIKRYQGMTNLLIFSMVETQLDIIFAIVVTAWYVKNPNHTHIKTIKTIFRYLKRSIDWKITYGGKKSYLSKDIQTETELVIEKAKSQSQALSS